MRRKTTTTLVLLLLIQLASYAQLEPLTKEKAAAYFKEIKAICDKDNAQLWGVNMWVPTLFIDYETRDIIANDADAKKEFIRHGDVYTGKFPEDKIIANSTTNLDGKKWVMVIAHLPDDSYNRNQLVLHEMFHYVQDEIGLTPKDGYDNNHMDEMYARIYLKLEWAALNNAVTANTAIDEKTALSDALIFRAYRRRLYPQAELSENRFEMHEGLPEYTSHKLCTNTKEEFREKVLHAAKAAWERDAYVRSFGYYSGFAYAYFLDGSDWQKDLTPDTDLGKLVQKRYNIMLPQNIEKTQENRRDIYGYNDIYNVELALKQRKDELFASNKRKFEDGSILTLSLQSPNVGFNPNNLQAFGDKGTIYPTMTLIDAWGNLSVQDGGCLLYKNWKKAVISAKNIQINGTEIKGEGWELKLNEGYKIVQDGESYTIASE